MPTFVFSVFFKPLVNVLSGYFHGDVSKTRIGAWGMGNGEWEIIPKKLSWSPRSMAKRRGFHVESER